MAVVLCGKLNYILPGLSNKKIYMACGQIVQTQNAIKLEFSILDSCVVANAIRDRHRDSNSNAIVAGGLPGRINSNSLGKTSIIQPLQIFHSSQYKSAAGQPYLYIIRLYVNLFVCGRNKD